MRVKHNMDFCKTDEYKLRPNGKTGYCITIPDLWVEENNLKSGDIVCFFRSAKSNDLILQSKNQSIKDSHGGSENNGSESTSSGNNLSKSRS